MLFQWINTILLDTLDGNNRSKHSRCDVFFSTVLGFEIWAWQWVCEPANRTFYRRRNEAGECDLWKIYPFDLPQDALFSPWRAVFKECTLTIYLHCGASLLKVFLLCEQVYYSALSCVRHWLGFFQIWHETTERDPGLPQSLVPPEHRKAPLPGRPDNQPSRYLAEKAVAIVCLNGLIWININILVVFFHDTLKWAFS